MTSRDVVNIVQRRLKRDKIKVGHCGTLDPLAEGVLLLGVGPAVRLTSYVQEQPKTYVGQFRLGASSQSGDLEDGYESHDELPQPTPEQLQAVCVGLTGQIEQVPPAHSAIWVDGQRAYERVRRGEDVQMPTRTVTIHDLELTDYEFPMMTLTTSCGSGTYIRTLGIDVARAAGSMSVMTHLVRTAIGAFQIEDAVSIDQLREAPLEPLLQPAALAVTQLPRLIVDDDMVVHLKNGLCINPKQIASQLDELPTAATEIIDESDVVKSEANVPHDGIEIAAFTQSGQICAILRRKSRGWCPFRGFPTAVTSA